MFIPTRKSSQSNLKWLRLSNRQIIYYRTAGSGHPLILIHGWGGSSRYWQGSLERLSDVRTVYAIDLPGHGESPPLKGKITPRRLAELIIEIADVLGLESFDLNGHSYSANVTTHVSVGWPQRVSRLILTCPSTYRNEGERHLVTQVHRLTGLWVMMRGRWMKQIPQVSQRIGKLLFYSMSLKDERVRQSIEDFLFMDRHTGIQLPLNATMPRYIETLESVPSPTLVVGARQDSIMPDYGPPTVARLIPVSHLEWIESCGHLPMVERPQMYNYVLRKFLLDEI